MELTDTQIAQYIEERNRGDVMWIASEGIPDPGSPYTEYTVYVNLTLHNDGTFFLHVYDGDIGGPTDDWVMAGYDIPIRAAEEYLGRVKEVRENIPGYVQNVFGG